MDIKAMAKSKRSHTKHNQPRKPHQNPPKPTSSNNNPSNLKQDTKEKKKVVPPKPSLPSNWDRYDDNLEEEAELGHNISTDSGSGKPGFAADGSKLKKAVEVDEEVKIKSKGADFRELIAQAKESKQQHYYAPSFGDNVDDFYQGLAPMLAVRSEGLPSWDRDDDFLMDDDAATIEEASRFSLNFEALAEELAKADLAKRLFIEPDLLPPELRGPDANENYEQVPEKRVTTVETFEELYSIYLADEKMAESEDANEEGTVSSSDCISRHPDSSSVVDVAKSKSNDTSDLDAIEIPRHDQASKQNTTTSSQFLADAAEAELDTLLNSSGKLKLSNAPATQVKASTLISQQGTSTSKLKGDSVTHEALLPHSMNAHKPAQINISLEDELDDLLGTSNSKGSLFQSTEMKAGSTLGIASQHFPDRSTPAFSISACSLDDELDNLLEETSKPTAQPNLVKSPDVEIASSDFPPSTSSSHPASKPKVLYDFDSWFDTIS